MYVIQNDIVGEIFLVVFERFCPHVFGDVDGNGFTGLLVGNIFQTCQHVLDMLPVVFVGNLFVGVFELVRFGLYSVAVGHRIGGIDIQLESMDLATYLDVTASGDYQAAIGGYTSSNVLAYALGVFHSSSINASNKTRTNDPAIDAAIEKVQATLDPEENVAAITELNKLVNENCPQVPLYLKNNTRAFKSDLQGFNVNAGGTTYYEQFSWGN